MKRALFWLAIFFAGWLAGVVGSFPAFATGLFLQETIANILGLMIAGVFVTLGAGWAGNVAYRGTRTRLGAVLVVSESLAISLVFVYLVLIAAAVYVDIPPFLILVIMVAVISAGASLGTVRMRTAGRLRRDVLTSVAMLIACAAVVILVIYIASLFGLTGA